MNRYHLSRSASASVAVCQLVVTLLTVACSNPTPMTEGPGFYISSKAFFDADQPSDVVKRGAFGYMVSRCVTSPREAELIRLAEAVYPDSHAVIALALEHPPRGQSPALPDEELWWFTSFGNIRIPFAITADAVKYYVDKMAELESTDFGPPPTSPGVPPRTPPHGDLLYGAWVERRAVYENVDRRFEDVWVVNMNLKLELHFGELSALMFYKERVVIIDNAMRILAVIGEGVTRYVVA